MATLINRECWLLRGFELLHGHITSQDLPSGKATMLADGADDDYITDWAHNFLLTPEAARAAIAEAVRKLAHVAARFDREQEREQAVMVSPSLLSTGEQYGGMDI